MMAKKQESLSAPKQRLKIVLLGEGRVGKTSLLARYIHNTFNEDQQATVQAAFMSKQLDIDSQQVEVSIWDTAGQERFHSLAPLYYRDADAALLVYDITDRDSLNRVRHWVRELRTMVGDDIVLAILGNKADLAKQRTVPEEEAAELAESIGAGHHLVSAKTGLGLDLAVLGTARKVLAERERDTAHGSVPGRTGRRPGSLVISDADTEANRKQSACC